MKWLAAIFGVTFLVLSVIETLSSLGFRIYVKAMNDPLAGYTLFIISITYLIGYIKYSRNVKEGLSYIFVASLLAVIMVGIEVSIMVNDMAEAYILFNEDYAKWSLLDDLYPHLIFGLFSIIPLRMAKKELGLDK